MSYGVCMGQSVAVQQGDAQRGLLGVGGGDRGGAGEL